LATFKATLAPNAVTSYIEVWIEIVEMIIKECKVNVTSYIEVWIEIAIHRMAEK